MDLSGQPRADLETWFQQMLHQLDEEGLDNADELDELRGRVAEAFAAWRVKHGHVVKQSDSDSD